MVENKRLHFQGNFFLFSNGARQNKRKPEQAHNTGQWSWKQPNELLLSYGGLLIERWSRLFQLFQLLFRELWTTLADCSFDCSVYMFV